MSKRIRVAISERHLRRLYAKGYLWATGPAQPRNPSRIAANENEWAFSVALPNKGEGKYLRLSLGDPTHKITPEGTIKELKKCQLPKSLKSDSLLSRLNATTC